MTEYWDRRQPKWSAHYHKNKLISRLVDDISCLHPTLDRATNTRQVLPPPDGCPHLLCPSASHLPLPFPHYPTSTHPAPDGGVQMLLGSVCFLQAPIPIHDLYRSGPPAALGMVRANSGARALTPKCNSSFSPPFLPVHTPEGQQTPMERGTQTYQRPRMQVVFARCSQCFHVHMRAHARTQCSGYDEINCLARAPAPEFVDCAIHMDSWFGSEEPASVKESLSGTVIIAESDFGDDGLMIG